MIAVEKVNAVSSINVPQKTVQNVNQIPTVVPNCIAVDNSISPTTMSADETVSCNHALPIQTVPGLAYIANPVKRVGLTSANVNTTVNVKVMANAVDLVHVLPPTASVVRILTVAVRNTAVNKAHLACPASVVQAVWVSIVRMMAIADRLMSIAISIRRNVKRSALRTLIAVITLFTKYAAPNLRAELVVSRSPVLANTARQMVIAVEKVNAVSPINVPQTTVQNVNQIPTVTLTCIAVDIGISPTTMSADVVASVRHAIAIQTVPCLMNIVSPVKLVGLAVFTVDPTMNAKVMTNAVDQAYVLLPTARAIPILTVAVRNIVVNTARLACPASVVQAVWVSIVRMITIVDRLMSIAI